MTLQLLYFASLREKLGRSGEALNVQSPLATVAALRAHLAARGGIWQEALNSANLRVAVNQDMAKEDTALRAGDEVAFFPPVTGG